MKKEEIISALLNIADCLDAGEDAVDRYIYDGLENDVEALREAARMICEMQQCKHQWISVKDSTPELPDGEWASRMVIACRGKGVSPMIYARAKVRGKTVERWKFYWGRISDEEVTHWMPLPEPPKEVK